MVAMILSRGWRHKRHLSSRDLEWPRGYDGAMVVASPSLARTGKSIVAMVVAVSAVAACSAGNEGTTGDPGATSSSGFTTSTGGGGGGLGGEGSCASVDQDAAPTPLNLYIMLDRSSSMTGTKWDAAKAGLSAFTSDPASAGIEVGFNSFPEGAPGCDQTVYKAPAVGWGELPAIAAQVDAELGAIGPDGFSTPIYQALGGALLGAIEMAETFPEESAAVLLITDGAPQGPTGLCGGVNPEDPQQIANLAEAARGFGVTTFVVGLPGVDQTFANLVAQAGGSESAILVGTTNVEQEFRQALAKVRGDLLPCEYAIPEAVLNGDVQLTEVNVKVGLGGGEAAIVPQNADCDGAGWYYDDPAAPTQILLCPATCDAVSTDPNASIRIALGCATIVS